MSETQICDKRVIMYRPQEWRRRAQTRESNVKKKNL